MEGKVVVGLVLGWAALWAILWLSATRKDQAFYEALEELGLKNTGRGHMEYEGKFHGRKVVLSNADFSRPRHSTSVGSLLKIELNSAARGRFLLQWKKSSAANKAPSFGLVQGNTKHRLTDQDYDVFSETDSKADEAFWRLEEVGQALEAINDGQDAPPEIIEIAISDRSLVVSISPFHLPPPAIAKLIELSHQLAEQAETEA